METTEPSSEVVLHPNRWQVLAVVLIGLFMTHVSISNINVLLPSIQDGLSTSPEQLQWILSGYILTFGMVLIPAGRAGDIFGRRSIFIWGVAIFTLASVWASVSLTPLSLIIARLFQGVGSGLLNPQGLGFIQQYFVGVERARAFGFYGTAVGLATAVGPILGGLIVEAIGVENGWRATIALNVPLGLFTIAVGLMWIPKTIKKLPLLSIKKSTLASLKQLDLPGSILIGAGVFGILLPFIESKNNLLYWITLPLGILIVVVWVRWQKKQETLGLTPMVKLQSFKNISYRNGLLISSFYFFGFTSVWVLIAIYMQSALGHSAFTAAMVIVPGSILAAISATLSGRLVSTFQRYVVIFGVYLTIVGIVTSTVTIYLHENGFMSEWWLLLTLSFVGIGQGAVISPNHTLTLKEIKASETGSLGGVMQTGQRIGTSVGITLVTTIFFVMLPISTWAIAFAWGALVMILVLTYVLYISYKDLKIRQNDNQQ